MGIYHPNWLTFRLFCHCWIKPPLFVISLHFHTDWHLFDTLYILHLATLLWCQYEEFTQVLNYLQFYKRSCVRAAHDLLIFGSNIKAHFVAGSQNLHKERFTLIRTVKYSDIHKKMTHLWSWWKQMWNTAHLLINPRHIGFSRKSFDLSLIHNETANLGLQRIVI